MMWKYGGGRRENDMRSGDTRMGFLDIKKGGGKLDKIAREEMFR